MSNFSDIIFIIYLGLHWKRNLKTPVFSFIQLWPPCTQVPLTSQTCHTDSLHPLHLPNRGIFTFSQPFVTCFKHNQAPPPICYSWTSSWGQKPGCFLCTFVPLRWQRNHLGWVYLKCLLPSDEAFVNSTNHQEPQTLEQQHSKRCSPPPLLKQNGWIPPWCRWAFKCWLFVTTKWLQRPSDCNVMFDQMTKQGWMRQRSCYRRYAMLDNRILNKNIFSPGQVFHGLLAWRQWLAVVDSWLATSECSTSSRLPVNAAKIITLLEQMVRDTGIHLGGAWGWVSWSWTVFACVTTEPSGPDAAVTMRNVLRLCACSWKVLAVCEMLCSC